MPELDPFDARLTSAVRAFADRAETGVDAMAVAAHAVRPRRRGAFAWLAVPLPVPAAVVIATALLAALLAWSVGAGAPWGHRTSLVPVPAPTEAPAPTTTLDPGTSPAPSAGPSAAKGDVLVTGTEVVAVQTYGRSEKAGDVTRMRDVVATTVDTMSDPRVTGKGTIRGANDSYGVVGPQWGTYRLENADGAWEGAWSGALWNIGNASHVTAWLVGSGAYEGYTYYFRLRGSNALTVDGIIFRGSPPAPAPAQVPAPVPVAAPTPATAPTPAATPTPAAMPVLPTDGEGAERVVGTAAANLQKEHTQTKVGDVTQLRDGVAVLTLAMNDPRVTGMATWDFDVDFYGLLGSGALGPEWGPLHLETDDGAWEGPCSGATWRDGDGLLMSCWLVGVEAHEGSTFYLALEKAAGASSAEVDGIIFPGSPPAP
jgi:hypothetical protein